MGTAVELSPNATPVASPGDFEANSLAERQNEPVIGNRRVVGGGPAGKEPLVRAVRAKQTDMRKVAHLWLDRFTEDADKAIAELVTLVLVVADVPFHSIVEKEDVQNREPQDCVQDIVAALALEASEKGADFTQHWLVSRERGAQRVRENYPAFWCTLASSAPCQALIGGLLQFLHDWILALADCQFRSIRFAATVAGLQLVEGLGIQCRSLRNFCRTAEAQLLDAEAQVVTAADAEAVSSDGCEEKATTRVNSLKAELEHAQRFAADMTVSRDSLGISLLSRRTKDVDPELRRNCFEAMLRWSQADAESFSGQLWTKYLHFGLHDREPKARVAVLSALGELFKGDPTSTSLPLQHFAQQVRARVLARCHDVDPLVGAAAIRVAVLFASRQLLAEEEFDPITDHLWDKDPSRRGEAAEFVSRQVFSEDILDYPVSSPPTTLASNASIANVRRRLQMILQFLNTYTDGHFELVDRLVASFWRRTSCLEDWEVLSSLALPGSEHTASGDVHTLVIYLMEAIARQASQETVAKTDAVGYAEAVLDRAARAFAPRLQALLVACQAEPLAMRRAASFTRFILRHCARGRSLGGNSCGALVTGALGDNITQTLKTAFLRQPDPEALEYIAEAFAYLLDLATGARATIKDIAESLKNRFLSLSPLIVSGGDDQPQEIEKPPPLDALLATVTRLRMLAKAYDVSICDLRNFGAMLLELLDERATAIAEGRQPKVSALLAITALELLMLIIVRQTISTVRPTQFASCVSHDAVDEEQFKLVPIAVKDLFSLVVALLKSDPNQLVRTASLATSVTILSTWWNSAIAARMPPNPVDRDLPWTLSLNDDLTQALWEHLGHLLLEANAVPPSTRVHIEISEGGNTKNESPWCQLFTLLQQSAATFNNRPDVEVTHIVSDVDRVRLAVLASCIVSSCRHEDLVGGPLPALVLSQGLSPRDDMQEIAWTLMRRLRKEGLRTIEAAEAFFVMLLRAVRAVHQDAGAIVARDLSLRLLQHVSVGKLAPTMQAGFVIALRAGVDFALGESTKESLLDALLPWVTKHVLEDESLRELANWTEQRPGELGAIDRAKSAGIPIFVKVCRQTAEKCEPAVAGACADIDGTLSEYRHDIGAAIGAPKAKRAKTRGRPQNRSLHSKWQ